MASSAEPGWVRSGRAPELERDHWVGYALVSEADGFDAARRAALSALSHRIQVRVSHVAEDNQSQMGSRYEQRLTSSLVVSSNVTLSNVEIRQYTFDRKIAVLAFVPRRQLARGARARRDKKVALFGDCPTRTSTEEHLLACKVRFLDAVRDSEFVLASTVVRESDTEIHAYLLERLNQTEQMLDRLATIPAKGVAAVSARLANQLRTQHDDFSRVQVAVPVYGRSSYSSQLGASIAFELENRLRAGRHESPSATILGNYREGDSSALTISLTLVDHENGSARATARAQVAKGSLNGIGWRPRNFTEALDAEGVLAQSELEDGRLAIQAWTNRSPGPAVFVAGETMRFLFRVNRPAYLRLTYHLATGQHVMLEPQFFIDLTKVNRGIVFPVELEVAGPFGLEALHVTASTEPLPPLTTDSVTIAGERYDAVVDGARGAVQHRGFAKKKPSLEISEVTLPITTLAHR